MTMVGVDTGRLFRRTRDTNRLDLSKSLRSPDYLLLSSNKPGELYGDSITNNAIDITSNVPARGAGTLFTSAQRL